MVLFLFFYSLFLFYTTLYQSLVVLEFNKNLFFYIGWHKKWLDLDYNMIKSFSW